MIKKVFIVLILCTFQMANADESIVRTEFFNNFNDEYLKEYIYQALQNNHDLKQTKHKVEQYRQNMKISFGKELPSLSVGADYLGVHVPQLDNFALRQNAFVMPFIASYEPDFLLKNRDKTKSLKKSYEAVLEERKAVYIAILSDVATNYINILEYDYLINKQLEIVIIEQQRLEKMQKKYSQGIIDANSLNVVSSEFENSKNTLENLRKQRNVILNSFATLIAISPDDINKIKRGNIEEFEYTMSIPDEISSDVIFARPDVLAMEKQLAKAKIDIRVARKEFLPSFNITGLWAFNTIAPGTFFSWESSLAAIFAGTTMDIFKGGMKVANLKLQKAKYEQLFEQYKQLDLNAVKEVNTALCMIKFDTNIDVNASKILQYEKSNYSNSQKKYNRGTISYPEFLEAKKKLLNSEQNKSQVKTTRLINYITLYKAVGGML